MKLLFRPRSPVLLRECADFAKFLRRYIKARVYVWFAKFERLKDALVDLLYRQRGKYTRPFMHFGTIGLVFIVIIFGPFLLSQVDDNETKDGQASVGVLGNVSAFEQSFYTLQAEEVRQYRGGEIITHVVQEGETVSSVAERFGLKPDTILWENNLTAKDKIKPGTELKILPIDGVRHKVQRGETIYTVGKKYGLEDESQVQMIIDYPFNEFLNDETFELSTGQYVMVPGGEKPDEVPTAPTGTAPRTRGPAAPQTPDAGAVTASGSFVWPASGKLTQGYQFYHKAYDIANRGGGPILASDGGTVTVSGWSNGGYGNHVIIDHGNGFVTLYGHFSVLQVKPGQRVNRGDVIGQMGSTGRSTGTHLHFEIRRGGVLLNPGSFLR